jgi:hypothetical protein
LQEAGLDERTRQDFQRGPIDFGHDGGREVALEKRDRPWRIGEHLFEKRVVRETCGHQAVVVIFHGAG